MKGLLVSITGLFVLLGVNQLNAVEPLSTVELSSHCAYYAKTPDGKDATFCVRYIQGFIDGAVATDERVIANISGEDAREETFSERAFRTRIGNSKRYGSTYYADFCLGKTPLKEVVDKVVGNLGNKKGKEVLARDAVFKTLRNYYPCKVKRK